MNWLDDVAFFIILAAVFYAFGAEPRFVQNVACEQGCEYDSTIILPE